MPTTILSEAPAESGPTVLPEKAALLADARRLSDALSGLIRVVQFRDRDRACCYDVSVSQCHALKGVVDQDGPTMNELAAHLYLDKSTASRIASGLEDKGLLQRERSAEDGRVVRLIATQEGRRIHEAIERDLADEYARLLSDFDPEVRSAVTALVSRLGRSVASRVVADGGNCCVVE